MYISNTNYIKFPTGDEIVEINGNSVQGMSHAETIGLFKNVREGTIVLKILRRK